MRFKAICLACCLGMTMQMAIPAGQANAAEPVPVYGSHDIWFEGDYGLTLATMTVSGPKDYFVSIFVKEGLPRFNLPEYGVKANGVYRFEISAASEEAVKVSTELDNGRGKNQSDKAAKPFYLSGVFEVRRGAIVQTKSDPKGEVDRDAE